MKCPHESSQSLESRLHLLRLHTPREMHDMVFVYKILNSQIDSPDPLFSINIHVPGRLVVPRVLPCRPPFVRRNYLHNSPIIRLQRSANTYSEHLDFFLQLLRT